MSTKRAEVRDGRLVLLDTDTDLPDGTIVELAEADPFSRLSDDECKEMNASIDRGLAQAKRGEGRPARDLLREL